VCRFGKVRARFDAGGQLDDYAGRSTILGPIVPDRHSRPAAQKADALADGMDIDSMDRRSSQNASVPEHIVQPRRSDVFDGPWMLHGCPAIEPGVIIQSTLQYK
jgi:hypothetical protein